MLNRRCRRLSSRPIIVRVSLGVGSESLFTRLSLSAHRPVVFVNNVLETAERPDPILIQRRSDFLLQIYTVVC